jgi:hypothetical protein
MCATRNHLINVVLRQNRSCGAEEQRQRKRNLGEHRGLSPGIPMEETN